MKKNNIIIVSIAAVVAIAAITLYAISRSNNGMMDDTNNMMNHGGNSEQAYAGAVDKSSSDYQMYSKLNGDDYDRMFLANMITHHQGAVGMANLALTNAMHQEIKDMANAIIASQTKEIKDMQSWQRTWSYPANGGDMMDGHSSMSMMDDMAGMAYDLKSLSGDEFDKKFLSSMIEHHQSAINMAYPGKKKAKHHEVKTLTGAIITAQSKEIAQMKKWQRDWNY